MVEVPGLSADWVADRITLVGYRLRAAWYGLRIQKERPFRDIAGWVGTLAGFPALATLATLHWKVYGEILFLLLIAAVWPVIRHLGSISSLMKAAAATEEGTNRIFNDMQEGMASTAAFALLREIYGPMIDDVNATLVERGWPCQLEFVDIENPDGTNLNEFACAVIRTAGIADLSSILGSFQPDRIDPRNAARRADSRQSLMRSWRKLHGGERPMGDEIGANYCLADVRLTNMSDGPRLVLDLDIAEYGQIARTSESLINEFAMFAFLTRARRQANGTAGRILMRPATALRCMRWRWQAHQDAKSAVDLFFRPWYRAAGLGVALATIESKGGEKYVYLGDRSDTVGTYPGVMHVIPAGHCDTMGTHKRLTSLKSAAIPDDYLSTVTRREYLEEWFNDKQLEESKIPNLKQQVDQKWRDKVREIEPIRLTGLAFDLLNLRPEICAAVEVELSGDEVLNWEYAHGSPPDPRSLRELGTIKPSQMVQTGTAALFLAKDIERLLPALWYLAVWCEYTGSVNWWPSTTLLGRKSSGWAKRTTTSSWPTFRFSAWTSLCCPVAMSPGSASSSERSPRAVPAGAWWAGG